MFLWTIVALIVGWMLGFIIGRYLRFAYLKKEKKEAIKKSSAILSWFLYEKIVPFLPNFPFHPKDMVFIGKGVDYLVFDGLSEGNMKRIVFLEIKTGKSFLNSNEKSIRDVLHQKKVEYYEYRVNKG